VTFVIEAYPAWSWQYVRVAQYAATGGFITFMTLFTLRFVGLKRVAVERALIAYWPSGPLVLLFGGMRWHDAVDRYYQAGLLAMGITMLGAIAFAVWRLRTVGSIALCGGVVVGVILGAHDYLLSQGWLDLERPYLLHLGADLLILIAGAVLADRFVTSLRAAEDSEATLTVKVAERERDLAANYEQLRNHERAHSAAEERRRIMQDMHDGLGSQLLTSLAAVERGALDSKGMAQVLRDAMDDMRLAIDTLSPGHEGLLEALGNLRYRLEPRFRAAGVELTFAYRDLPEQLVIAAEDALQILRVLQESLTNVLKHAGATAVRVEISLQHDPALFVLAVEDNGCGFHHASPA